MNRNQFLSQVLERQSEKKSKPIELNNPNLKHEFINTFLPTVHLESNSTKDNPTK